MRRRLDRRAGLALPMAIVIVLAMSLLGLAAYSLMRAVIRETVYQSRSAQAMAVAEAGLEDALYNLSRNRRWKTGFNKKNFAGGYYTVTVSTDKNPWVNSHGYSVPIAAFGRAHRSVRAQANLTYPVPCYSSNTYTVNGLIDSYDSSVNANPSVFGSSAAVVSDGQLVTLAGGVRIKGNVDYFLPPAPNAATISGTIDQSLDTISVAPVDGSVYISSNNNSQIDNVIYDTATMNVLVATGTQPNALRAGTYYINNLYVYGDLRTDIRRGSVIIYLNGSLHIGSQGMIRPRSTSDTPGSVTIYGQGGSSYLLASTRTPASSRGFRGVIFSPYDTVTVAQTVYGLVIGSTVTVNTGAIIHYDVRLYDPNFPGGTGWIPGSWSQGY